MVRAWRSGIPSLLVIGLLAILLIGCPRKPPEPARPPTPPPPLEEVRPPVPPPPPPVARVVPEDDERARREQAFRDALAAFERELVHFDFDRSEIKEQFKDVLQRKAEFLKAYPNVRVQIEGHCDERGTVQYNLALGDRRAASAKAFLTALGIDVNRLSTISYGEERPLDSGHNEEAWTKNRRARFVVTGQ